MRVRTFNTRGIPHDSKRPVKGETRNAVGKNLKYKKARLWQHEAVEDLSFGDPEPPNVPRRVTLRKIKEEACNKELKINSLLSPVDSLIKMKYEGSFCAYIKAISKDPFYCFYWSPMQLRLYKDLLKFLKIEIDATGRLVKAIVAYNGEKSLHICTKL